MSKRYNIVYQNSILHANLTPERCSEILEELSEYFYSDETFNPDDLRLEEI